MVIRVSKKWITVIYVIIYMQIACHMQAYLMF